MTKKYFKSHLSHQAIAKIKSGIKHELAAFPDDRGRLDYCLEKASRVGDGIHGVPWAEQFIYIMNALIIHERSNLLQDKSLKQLQQMAGLILNAQKIRPRKSTLSFLYSEIYGIQSQIMRQGGKHWAAALLQQLSHYFVEGDNSSENKFQEFVLANRLLRLGNSEQALLLYDQVIDSDLPADKMALAMIAKLQCLTWALKFDERKTFLAQIEKGRISRDTELEIAWNELVVQTMQTGDALPMARAVASKKTIFDDTDFRVETALWLMTYSNKENLDWLKRINLGNRSDYRHSKAQQTAYHCATLIQNAYQSEVPLHISLKNLVDSLQELDKLLNIEKVLLVYAAVTRYFLRCSQGSFANMTLNEYQFLSQRLSHGKSHDLFQAFSDKNYRLLNDPSRKKIA